METTKPGRSRIRTALLTGAVGLGAAAVVGLGVPAIAAAATSDTDSGSAAAQAVGDRLTKIKDALSGLVSDGTITQEQADKVADTLDEQLPQRGDGDGPGGMGRGGFGLHLDVLATTLKLTEDELHTALHDGQTLAEIATEQGVSTDAVVDALVEAATARIDQAVADGRITAERATALKADLTSTITTFVTEGGKLGRGGPLGGMGGMGRGHHDGDGDGDGGSAPTPVPSSSPSAANSST